MALYKYKAITSTGEKINGTYSANSKDDVLGMLRQNKYYPISVEEVVQGRDISFSNFFRDVKTKDIALFCRQFHTMLNAGVTIINCLDILKQQTSNRKMTSVISDVYDLVQTGFTFSEALRKHENVIPTLLINMVAVGEVSGNLDTIMNRMATHYEKENRLKNKIRGAMVYPIMLSIVSVLVVIFLITFVLPTFVGMFLGSGVELPLPTKVLLSVSNIIINFWYVILIMLFTTIYLVSKYIKSSNGRLIFDSMKLRLPIIKSVTQKIITARFTRTLATLISSGIPLIQALEVVSKIVGNKIVEDSIISSIEEVRKGTSLSVPIRKIGIFPPMVSSMISIGEESGSLDEILDNTANYYDEEVEASLQKLTTLIEPVMIVIMALIIGAIIIAIVLPMFNMISTIQF